MDGKCSESSRWGEDVGILAMEVYFPRDYVSQADLEESDGVKGKYTVGLGQTSMGFCSDREDVTSICRTVTHNLLQNYEICPKDVGRLEVGTETVIDKSKSVKSSLMEVFLESGNHSLEGADTTNACFGGTQALFNAINWVESSSFDGRPALVVMGDIAVYAEGGARCTGGAGAMALLVGPNAPLVFDRGLRAIHIRHVYDFYKPRMDSEYPVVDGPLSVVSYMGALDACYQQYREKYAKLSGNQDISLSSFDGVVFHSPYGKLVQKSFARLAFLDFRHRYCGSNDDPSLKATNHPVIGNSGDHSQLSQFCATPLDSTYGNRELERVSLEWSQSDFEQKTKPSLMFSKRIGNMYTPSLYGCLTSYLISKNVDELLGQKIALFSYGSGLAAALFSLTVSPKYREQLTTIHSCLLNAKQRLDCRIQRSPSQFQAALKLREKLIKSCGSYEPEGCVTDMFPGTYYLTQIDEKFRRYYDRIPCSETVINGSVS